MVASAVSDTNVISVPVLPLRDVVVYPYMVVPLFVGRERSIKALEVAMASDKQVLVATQKNPGDDQPGEDVNVGSRDIEIMIRSLKSQFEQYVKLNRKIPTEILASVLAIEDGSRLAD